MPSSLATAGTANSREHIDRQLHYRAEDVALAVLQVSSSGNRSTLHDDVRHLVKQACGELIAGGRLNEAVHLLSLVPLPQPCLDAELLRLRTQVALYEWRRVTRLRRRLLLAIAGVLLYLFAVSPTLFVRLENPARVANHMSVLDWSEGLYWSVITAMTVGYGDIAPQTPYARLLSLWNATLGVTLMGVVAGLILGLVTPRRLA
jgi:hypothetical protein